MGEMKRGLTEEEKEALRERLKTENVNRYRDKYEETNDFKVARGSVAGYEAGVAEGQGGDVSISANSSNGSSNGSSNRHRVLYRAKAGIVNEANKLDGMLIKGFQRMVGDKEIINTYKGMTPEERQEYENDLDAQICEHERQLQGTEYEQYINRDAVQRPDEKVPYRATEVGGVVYGNMSKDELRAEYDRLTAQVKQLEAEVTKRRSAGKTYIAKPEDFRKG